MKKVSKITYIRFMDVKLFAMLMSGCMVAAGVKACHEENKTVKADTTTPSYTQEETVETTKDISHLEKEIKGFSRVKHK